MQVTRFGVDFGASSTVIVRPFLENDTETATVLSMPNLIHLAEEGGRITGQDVIRQGLVQSGSTARHLRHFILQDSPVLLRAGPYTASYRQEGRAFLASLIRTAAAGREKTTCNLAFSAPVDAPNGYREWLASVAAEAGYSSSHIIDELSAAATGYGIPAGDGTIVILIDIGADTLEVTIASLQSHKAGAFPFCRMISRALSDTGGRAIDSWLAGEMLSRWRGAARCGYEQAIRPQLLEACKIAKEELSLREDTVVSVVDPVSGNRMSASVTRAEFEAVLQRHDLNGTMDQTITRALAAAQSKGYEPDRNGYVLMTGGVCMIPMVREYARKRFSHERIRCDNPHGAIALGAARYKPVTGDTPCITRDYALRYWDPSTGRHQYRYIARKGTAYPTGRDIASVLISAAYDGQTQFGIALFAIGENGDDDQKIELVTDPHGGTRCLEQHNDEQNVNAVWINERTPTFIRAIPPGRKGEVRFELTFSIDPAGILRLTVRDVTTGTYVVENQNCAQLG